MSSSSSDARAQPAARVPARVEGGGADGRTATPTWSASSTSCSMSSTSASWDLDEPARRSTGSARSPGSPSLLADYESVRRRARPDADVPGEQVGGQDRGTWYYRNLALHIINYAQGAYEGFDGEADFVLDAVDLTTVHRAKGLEWPAVFVPSVTAKPVPDDAHGRGAGLAGAARPLRRAALRGKRRATSGGCSTSRSRERATGSRSPATSGSPSSASAPSPYYARAVASSQVDPDDDRPAGDRARDATTSRPDLASPTASLPRSSTAGMAFRLRNLIGFQPRLAPELGYGKAVHHVMRTVAEATQATGHGPDAEPRSTRSSTRASSCRPRTSPRTASSRTRPAGLSRPTPTKHEADLHRVWETERPFELHLDGVTVTGRADVILDKEGGVPTALAIVDYKTSTSGDAARPRSPAPGLRRRRSAGGPRRTRRLRPRPQGGERATRSTVTPRPSPPPRRR